MKLKKFLFLLLTAAAMISCDDNQTDNEGISSYPMTIGSTWTYDRTVIDNYYKSSTSDSILSSDTLAFEGTTWIEKDTIINKSKLMVFKTKENDFVQTVTTSNYHLLDKDGLKLIAYSYSGFMTFSYSENAFLKSTSRVSGNGKMNSRSQLNSGLYVFSVPVLSIQYPLTASSEWASFYSLTINKKVIGTDTLDINGQEYVCFKVLWTYPEGYTTKVTEWIAKEGILKREVDLGTIYLTDEQGKQINKIQSTECMTVKSLSIK